jgi:O-antigen ligase
MIAAIVGLLASPFYAYAILPPLALLILFALARFPQVGYYLVVFLIPLDVFRVLSDKYSALTISKFVGAWLVVVMVAARVADRSKPIRIRSNLWPLLALFMAACIASAALSPYRESVVLNIRQLVTAYLFFGLTVIFASWPAAFLRILPWVAISSVSIGAFLAVLGFAANLPQFAVNVLPQTLAFKRGTGTATDPNIFSLMVVFTMPLVAHMFFAAKGTGKRLGLMALFALDIMAIVATYSRSGVLVMLVILALIVGQHWRKFRVRYAGFVMLALTAAVVATAVLAPSSYWERVKSTFDPRNPSVRARIGYLRVGAEELQRRPVLGIGLGGFADAYAKSRYAASSPYRFTEQRARRAAHNTYMEVLVGTGVIGFAVFAILLASALRNYSLALRKLSSSEGREEMISMVKAYRLSLLAVLLDLLTLSRLSHKYLWIGLAMSQAALLLSEKGDDADVPARQ